MTGTLICTGIACFALGVIVCERTRFASIREIAEERKRQIDELGYGTFWDDGHTDDELVHMASAYMHPDDAQEWWPFVSAVPQSLAPFQGLLTWVQAEERRRLFLVKAAALLCAEIDRIDRRSKARRRLSERQFQLLWLIALAGLGLLAGVR